MDPQTQKYLRAQARLDTRVKSLERSNQTGYGSLESGRAIEVRDVSGDIVGTVGGLPDGSIGSVDLVPTPPPPPTATDATSGVESVVVRWDGSYVEAVDATVTVAYVGVHLHQDPTDPTWVPNIATELAQITPGGGAVVLPGDAGVETGVVLVSVSAAGVWSEPTDQVVVTPTYAADPSIVDEISSDIEIIKSDGLAPTVAPSVEVVPGINVVYLSVAFDEADNADPVLAYNVYVDGRLAKIDTASLITLGTDAEGAELSYIVDTPVTVSVSDFDGEGPQSDVVMARPRRIGTDDVGPGVITAELISADIATIADLTVGFVMSGRIQVGASYWTPVEGLVIPQPDGGTVTLPADGLTPAQITAHLIAKSLTVEGALDIQGGNNKVSGQVTLSNGITRPTAPPSLSQSYPYVQGPDPAQFGSVWYGLTSHHSDPSALVFAQAFFGGSLGAIDKTTGTPLPFFPDISSWSSQFNVYGGITRIGTSYYVLGEAYGRGGDWYIYRLDSSFAKVSERLVLYAWDKVNYGRSTLGQDASGNLMVAHPADSTLEIRRYGADLSDTLAGGRPQSQSPSFPNLNKTPASFIGEGVFDYGVSSIVAAIEGNAVFYMSPAGVRDNGYNFAAASGGRIRGLAYIDGMFKALDTDGRLTTYSNIRSDTTVTASYTWYDGVGTTRETQPSPSASVVLAARSWPKFESPPPPDNGVAGTAVDRANRIGVYMATAANARRLQTYLPVDPATFVATRQYVASTITTGGATEPITNGFVGAATGSPGSVVSADGASGIYGDGAVFAGKTPTAPTHAANKAYVDSRGASGSASVPALNVNGTVQVTVNFPAGRFATPPSPGGFVFSGSALRNVAGVDSITTTSMLVTVYNLTSAGSAAGTLYWNVIATS
jgi:hypothetical protein